MRCKNLLPACGCRVYHSGRPELCLDYRCLWHLGALPEEYRPDQCGVLFAVRSAGELCRVARVDHVVAAYEIREGALARDLNEQAIKLLAKTKVVYRSSLVDDNTCDFRGPDDVCQRLLGYLRVKSRYLRNPVLRALEVLKERP